MTSSGGPIKTRALGPDLARGFMLLFIALANSHYFLEGAGVRGGFPTDGSRLDRVVAGGVSAVVDGRAFPMFGVLFGYGVARIAARQTGQGVAWRSVRWLLWRRSLVLVTLGFVHAMLLYIGDILAAYGVLLFVGVWVLRWKDRWLLLTALFFLLLTALPSDGSMAVGADPPDPSMLPPNFLAGLQARLPVQPVIALLGPIGFACPYLVGVWAGRRRILERPEQHKTLLQATAVLGIGAAIAGALPVSLWIAGFTAEPQPLDRFGPLHDACGTLGGFGYAALIALIAIKLKDHPGRMTRAISAVGQRSLTCYLTQSVIWTVAFTPYLAGLADNLSITATALLATATWLLTVLLADLMRRAGYRGPFEILIRRITYRRPAHFTAEESTSTV
ncbi:DUF418 domain-containing protein [Kribbella monticola]|uniref:DUF418 domain-containing protein n=1 Tax=Kribbella monticola TaxID=2185285 RepID=UPI001E358FEB|nr:DUF418 domain-containing protein [Kribbella monticola]